MKNIFAIQHFGPRAWALHALRQRIHRDTVYSPGILEKNYQSL